MSAAHIIRFTPAEGGSEVPMALPAMVDRAAAIKVAKATARTAFGGVATLWAGVQLPDTGGVHDVLPRRLIDTFTSQRYRVAVTWPETNEIRTLRWFAFTEKEARELSQGWATRQGIDRLGILSVKVDES